MPEPGGAAAEGPWPGLSALADWQRFRSRIELCGVAGCVAWTASLPDDRSGRTCSSGHPLGSRGVERAPVVVHLDPEALDSDTGQGLLRRVLAASRPTGRPSTARVKNP